MQLSELQEALVNLGRMLIKTHQKSLAPQQQAGVMLESCTSGVSPKCRLRRR
jgi:hypothetical protein